jgi:hypothetical protein
MGFWPLRSPKNEVCDKGTLYLLFCLTSLSNRYYENYITTQTFWDAPSLPYHGKLTRRALDNAFFPDALPIKVLAYADDLLIFLSAPNEWETLTHHLHIYHLACNAKVN